MRIIHYKQLNQCIVDKKQGPQTGKERKEKENKPNSTS